jgi:hypothetical protein
LTIDGQMGWAKRVARGTTRFGPAQARPDPHKGLVGLARPIMAGHAWAAAAARGPARAQPV